MPRGGHSPHCRRHDLKCFPSAPTCQIWKAQTFPARRTPGSSPLLCRDMALQNALYTGDLARLQDLFPPHSTADLLLESRSAEPRWSSHERGEGQLGVGKPEMGAGLATSGTEVPSTEGKLKSLAAALHTKLSQQPSPWPKIEVMWSPE